MGGECGSSHQAEDSTVQPTTRQLLAVPKVVGADLHAADTKKRQQQKKSNTFRATATKNHRPIRTQAVDHSGKEREDQSYDSPSFYNLYFYKLQEYATNYFQELICEILPDAATTVVKSKKI